MYLLEPNQQLHTYRKTVFVIICAHLQEYYFSTGELHSVINDLPGVNPKCGKLIPDAQLLGSVCLSQQLQPANKIHRNTFMSDIYPAMPANKLSQQ